MPPAQAPAAPVSAPAPAGPFNGGKPLSPDQITSMRASLNIRPTSGNSTPGNDVSSQWAKFDQLSGKSPAADQSPSMAQRMGSDIKSAGENVSNDINGGGNPIVGGFKAASDAVSGVGQAASEVLPGAVRSGLSAVGNAAGGVIDKLGSILGSTKLAQDFVTRHPDAAKTLENFASVGNSAGNVAGGILAAGGAAEAGNGAVGAASKAADSIGKAVGGKTGTSALSYVNDAGEKVFTRVTPKELSYLRDEVANIPAQDGASQIHLDPMNSKLEGGAKELSREDFANGHPQAVKLLESASPEGQANLSKIQDTISPKLNAAETKSAINEDRLVRGTDSRVFGKQPDTVLPSEDVKQYSKTISKNIPDAAKMNDVQLSSAIDSKTSEMAQNLEPKMKAAPVDSGTIDRLTSSWEKLKADQLTRPEFLDNEAGNRALQGKFENYLQKAQDSENLKGVWDARKSYDDSIPNNVKQATTASSPVLQTRQEMWLENRRLLNGVINDNASGLGGTSEKAFSEMSDMYNAKQNILSKAKADLKGIAGGEKVKGFVKAHPVISKGAGLLVGDKVLKATTGFGI